MSRHISREVIACNHDAFPDGTRVVRLERNYEAGRTGMEEGQ